ncbi:type VII secretion integral membrane protein EccD [Hoyosella altamirensis]|uniref:type VII secretion integral membrane protein EccD n=1 Tax=Hoyosella altamirensis TaxID=616997 RepID=UPI00311AA866
MNIGGNSVVQRLSESLQPASGPTLCHVCVVTGHTQVDLALPDSVPLLLVLPRLAEIVSSREAGPEAAPTTVAATQWTLSRLGEGPLDLDLSLARLGVRSGEVLVLSPVEAAPPAPLFDDVIEAVAEHSAQKEAAWAVGRGRYLSYSSMLGAALAATLVLATSEPLAHLHLALAGVFLSPVLFALAVAARRRCDATATGVLLLSAIPVAAASVAHLIPGNMGAPHLIAAGAAGATMALLGLRAFPLAAALLIPAFGTAVTLSFAAMLHLVAGLGSATIAAILIAAAPFAIAAAPRLAMVGARLPIPPVPAPGTALNVADALHEDGSNDENDPLHVALRQKAKAAERYLIGVIATVSAVSSASAIVIATLTVTSGELSLPMTLLTAIVAAALSLRGRSIAATTPALLVNGTGALMAVSVLIAGAVSAQVSPDLVFLAALAVLVLAFVFGTLAPGRSYTPLQYRLAELAEYGLLAAIVPVACWALGVFIAIRGL